MEQLTDKQMKIRWGDIKKQIKDRQLLAYKVGIPIEKWDQYIFSIPPDEEINRIYNAIKEDRINKTKRIKESLSKIVGYRESNDFSKKSGVSNTYIRDIIEGKKTMAGYDIINRLELFLNSFLDDFEISIENPLTLKIYSQDYIGEIASEINRIADGLKHYCFELSEMARKQETNIGWNGKRNSPTNQIENSIIHLTELKDKIDTFWKVYIDKSS